MKTPPWILIILLSICYTLFLGHTRDSLFLIGLILTGIFAYGICKRPYFPHPFDFFLAVLWAYNALLPFFSILPSNSFAELNILTCTVLYYFIIRLFFYEKDPLKFLLFSYSLCLAGMSLIFLFHFFKTRTLITDVGEFDHIYDMRFLFRPFGFTINSWASTLLGGLGMCTASYYYFRGNPKKRIVLAIINLLLIYCMLLSFSRGIYLVIGFLLGSVCVYLIYSNRRKFLNSIPLAGMVIIIFILLLIPFKTEIAKTLAFNETTSQQRSISGRIEFLRHSKDAIRDNLWIGTGTGTYSLTMNEFIFERDYKQFNSISANTYHEILVEQGILGIVLWGILSGVILFYSLKNRNKTNIILLIFLLTIGLRECTFPNWVYPVTQWSVFTLIAVIINNEQNKKNAMSSTQAKVIVLVSVLIAVSLFILSVIRFQHAANNRKSLQAVENNELSLAYKYLQKSNVTPLLINQGILHLNAYIHTKEERELELSMGKLSRASKQNRKDNMIKNLLARLYLFADKPDLAWNTIEPLVRRFPDNSVYNLTKFEICRYLNLEKMSDIYLYKSIKLNPDILNSELWTEYSETAPARSRRLLLQLKEEILREFTMDSLDPIKMAIHGKLLFMLGETKAAKCMLLNSVEGLPNLLYPWYYLAQIEYDAGNKVKGDMYGKRFLLIYYGPFISFIELDRGIKNNVEKVIEEHSSRGEYRSKFSVWYNMDCMPSNLFYKIILGR